MRRLAWLAALPLAAHMVSMSTGELRIDGTHAVYELRMPLYEAQHMKDPERELFDHVRFRGARLVSKRCGAAGDALRCLAEYEFSAPPDAIEAECAFHKVTVPNHVHVLRAMKDGKTDQAVFDLSFDKAELRFRPPSSFERAASETASGVARALGGGAQILFLAALALAARSRRELWALALAFLAGQLVTALIVPATSWRPAGRFIEAALALTIAYLAVELLALPEAGLRWAVAGVLGLFHGLYFAGFLTTSELRAGWFLGGALVADAVAITLCALILRRAVRLTHFVRVAASVLLVTGMVWFFLRLRG